MPSFVRLLIGNIRRYRLDRDPRIEQIRKLAEQGRLSEFQARGYLNWLEKDIQRQIDCFNPLHRPPRAEQLYAGGALDIELGTLSEAEDLRIGLPLKGACHSLFIGKTGFGKTTAQRKVIREVHEHNERHPDEFVSIICIDRKGGDYADIPTLLGEPWLHLDIHETLRLGLQPPSGLPVNAWISEIATSFCARAQLVYGWVTIANIMRWLAAAMNEGSSQEPLFPSFQLILDVAYAAPKTVFASKAGYEESVTQALEGITQASGPLWEAFVGLDIERDIIAQRRHVVISIPNLSPPWLRQFLCDLLVSEVLYGRIHRSHRVDRNEVLFVIDEADQDCSRRVEQAFPDGMPPISQCIKQGREFGISMCIGLSALRPVSRMVLSNATHHFVFAVGDEEGADEACRTLFLPQSARILLASLRPGDCLFRQSGSWPHAMLARIDNVPPNRMPRPVRYDTHPFVPSKRLSEMPEVLEALDKRISEHEKTVLRQSRRRRAGLSERAQQLLREAAAHPYTPVARLWQAVGRVAPAAQNAVRQELESEKLAAFEQIRIASTTVLLIDLTPEGWRSLGQTPPSRTGRGGIAHRHFAAWIREAGARRGHKAEIESIAPGTTHPVDVMWLADGQAHAFEICVTCTANIPSHIRACLIQSDAVETLTIVTTQVGYSSEIQQAIASEFLLSPALNRIRFDVVQRYMKELF